MGLIESSLEKLATFQKRYAIPILIVAVVVTLFLGFGMSKMHFQTDLRKEMPEDLPIFVLNDKVTDTFGGQDTIILLFQLDDSLDVKGAINDIRNPYVIQSLMVLEGVLNKESAVESVTSATRYFRGKPFFTTDHVISILDSEPSSEAFFSRDYRSTLMYIKADVGSSEEKIIQLAKVIQNNLDATPQIPGVKVHITGNPAMRVTILQLLTHDASFTLFLAGLIIFLLLIILQKSIIKALLIFTPLLLGLIWTIGAMGWLGIPISIATAGLGAMVLGLGVEYGVFMLTRYREERDTGSSQLNSLRVAVPGVGSAIFGSGLTTIVGFLALTLSIMPMMQHLGISLALGITFSLLAAVFVAPVIILVEENFEYWYTNRKHNQLSIKKENHSNNKR